MFPLRRLTAALSSVLLLQFMLLGSGAFCTMHGGSSRGMPGMAMPGITGADMHHASPTGRSGASVAQAPAGDDHGSSDACRGPWAPGACVSMASCLVVTAAVPVRAAGASATPTHTLDTLEPLGARAGPTFAPELPPPRA